MKKNVLLICAVFLALTVSCKKDKGPEPKTYPKDGLVSYFDFNNNLQDRMGNTADGINYNGATFTPGVTASAITFNGTSHYVQFERDTYRDGNNVSFSLWFKKSTSGSGMYLAMCSDFGAWTSAGYAGMAISLPTTQSAKGAFTADVWTHMVGTYNGTDIKVYIDGELIGTYNHPGDITGSVKKLTLGFSGSSYWGGSIDDLFIYDKALTQAEVTQLFEYKQYLLL